MRSRNLPALVLGGVFLLVAIDPGLAAVEAAPGDLTISPREVALNGQAARQRLIVSGTVGGRRVDLTRQARFHCDESGIVTVEADGSVSARGDGDAQVVATVGGSAVAVPVRVRGMDEPRHVTFELDVLPILTRAGCNAGACHGKARGQNGFPMSLLGFDPEFDLDAITREGRGRRVFPANPGQSLLLLKGSAQLPHGGGRRLEVGGGAYETIRLWIEQGMPRSPADSPRIERVTIEPAERTMGGDAQQQLIVTAHYSDGKTGDVTHLAAFQSNESAVAAVSPDGLVKTGSIPGEAAVSARFCGLFATCDVAIPLPGDVPVDSYTRLPRSNFIDGHVWSKLQRLGIVPSGPAEDATFLRRASLDAIGRLPSPEETRAFLEDSEGDKRARLVGRLLERPEYADHWANKWLDLIRPNPFRVGRKAVWNLDAWVRDAFRTNKPYDQFIREIVAARGSTFRDGAVTIFRDRREPEEAATLVSQLFLGIRLECARCHQHPFESWSQADFYGFAAYFARIGRKGTGISPPISGSEEMLFTAKSGEVKHPLTGLVVPPKPLFGKAPTPEDPEADPREVLARWMTSPENPYFAQVIVNRVWAEIMVRGLVEPVDDLRATNPPSNGPLLLALAEDFRRHGHDLKHLIRTIMTSSAYGLTSETVERNVSDTRHHSRHYRQRLRAEVLLDALVDITGVDESFEGMPPRSRAAAVWTHRTPSLSLDTFGRPDPNQDPPCERISDTSVVQALHLMNAPNLHAKLASETGRVAALAGGDKSPREIVDELYLLAYCRFPTEEERSVGVDLFNPSAGGRRQAVEDLLWALINSAEFVFKD